MIVILAFLPAWVLADYWGTVQRVLDAENLEIRTDRGEIVRVTLSMIDAPEPDQPFGELVPIVLAALTENQRVRVTPEGVGRYRTIARVYYNGGRDGLSSVLVYGGLAWCRDQDDIECMFYQRLARASNFGLWIEPRPLHPRDWRAGAR